MMKSGVSTLFLFSAMMLFACGCVTEPGIDKEKFSELNRTMQELKTSVTSDNPCGVSAALLQRLASGTAALKDKVASKRESDLLAAYSRLLATYNDGLLLCQSRTHLSDFQFVPKGRIYVSQELDPLVEKYGLSTERHLYKPTGQYWRSIAEDSIREIWESEQSQIKNIENMVNYS